MTIAQLVEDGILDQLAKYERAKIAERSRRGKLSKARDGKIVGGGPRPTYGFAYNERRDGYVVDATTMLVVRSVFSMIGEEGMTISAVKNLLECEGAPTPSRGLRWSKKTIREIILNDCYRPHTYPEIENLVSPKVAGKLDPNKCYGVSWYGVRRIKLKQIAGEGPHGRQYRRRQKAVKRLPEEWVAVPVPDAGVPRQLWDAARDVVKNNSEFSSAGGRFWELSGGVLFCGECGRRMSAHRQRKTPPSKGSYSYYRCPSHQFKGKRTCPNRKLLRAEEVEDRVWEFVSSLMQDPARLRDGLNAMIEERRKAMRSDSDREAKAWLGKLAQVDHKQSAYQDQQAEGLITIRRVAHQAHCSPRDPRDGQTRAEGVVLRRHREQIEQLERDRDAVIETYANMVPEALDVLTAEKRTQLYRILRLRVSTELDGTLKASGEVVSAPSVCRVEPTYQHVSTRRSSTGS